VFGGARHAVVCRSAHGVHGSGAASWTRSGQHPALIMSDPRAAVSLSSSPPATGRTSAAAPRHTLVPSSAAETAAAAAAAAEIVGIGTDATSRSANGSVDAQTVSEDTAASSGQVGGPCMLQVCILHVRRMPAPLLTCRCEACCRTGTTMTMTTTCSSPSCSACSYMFPQYGCGAVLLSRHTHSMGALSLRFPSGHLQRIDDVASWQL
jgi:hypothetical protein